MPEEGCFRKNKIVKEQDIERFHSIKHYQKSRKKLNIGIAFGDPSQPPYMNVPINPTQISASSTQPITGAALNGGL